MNKKVSPWCGVNRTAVLGLAAAVLVACGGGGDDGGGDTTAPSVSSTVVSNAKYAQKALLTIEGTNLDAGLTVTATGCAVVTRSTTAPLASTATTAYYQCTVSAVGAGQFAITRASGGTAVATQAFTVPIPQVTMTLSNGAAVAGTLVLTLAPDKTPITVDNFLAYVNSGFYNGTAIHRVSPGFVIQGGGYSAPIDTNTPTAKTTNAAIALEVGKGLSNTQWTIAMARSSDPASATSQFYVNLVDNSGSLDPSPLNGAGFAVFGSVSSGTSVVTSVVSAPCSAIPFFFLPSGECTPSPNVVITSAVQSQ